MDSAQLAKRLRLTPMAVRQHLYALQREKLVAADERPVPIGRPAKHWRLTRASNRLFPDAYAELNVALIDAVGSTFGPERPAARARIAGGEAAGRVRPAHLAVSAVEGATAAAGPGAHRRRLHGRSQARRSRGLSLHREPLPDLRRGDGVPGLLHDGARSLPHRVGSGRVGRTDRAHRVGRPTMCLPRDGGGPASQGPLSRRRRPRLETGLAAREHARPGV